MSPTNTTMRMPAWLEQAWLTRYLDRQLSGDETAWFEAYALDKPELLDVIDADTRLRDALTADSSAGRTDAPPRDESAVASTSAAIPFQRVQKANSPSHRDASRWLPLAAALVLGLGSGAFAVRLLAPQGNADVVASPTRVIYDTMRGEAAPPRVEHADSASPFVLIEVAVPPGAQNIILHMDGKTDQALAPSPDGFVSVLLARGMLQQHHLPTVSYSLADGSGKHSIDLEMPQRKME